MHIDTLMIPLSDFTIVAPKVWDSTHYNRVVLKVKILSFQCMNVDVIQWDDMCDTWMFSDSIFYTKHPELVAQPNTSSRQR